MMKAYIRLACLCLVFGASPALAEKLDFSKSDPEAVALSEKAWESSIAEAKADGGSASIRAFKLDLNGDGKPEIIGELKSAYLCGAAGPCFFVMADKGGYDVFFSVPGVEDAKVLDSRTKGWRDIELNDDHGYAYDGSTYRAK
jgi:hypothetical protein